MYKIEEGYDLDGSPLFFVLHGADLVYQAGTRTAAEAWIQAQV